MPLVPAAPPRISPAPGPSPGLSAPDCLRAALRDAAARWDGRTVLRVEVPAAPADALAWLAAQPAAVAPRMAWADRDGAEQRAAVGSALTVDAETLDDAAAVERAAALLPAGARLYGSVRFDAARAPAPEWAAFGRVRFVLPRAELVVRERRAVLAAHVAPGEPLADALADLVRLADHTDAAPAALPYVQARTDRPGRAGWTAAVRAALAAFASGALAKVVLARRADLTFDAPVGAVALLRRLAPAAPRCFHILTDAGDGSAFVCASPERLFRIETDAAGVRRLATEAVAGTRPRAADDATDDALLGELMESDKDRREHAFVRDAIAERLAPLATSVTVDAQAGAMTLARGRHLRTGIAATLAPHATVTAVLRALHPTPAVGGTPREAARLAIAAAEPFDRGLYAGAVGWIGRDAEGREAAEFAVGIRSALVRGRRVSLYSGAGIVAGSVPAEEWTEIEGKLADFARVLGTTPRAAEASGDPGSGDGAGSATSAPPVPA